MAKKIKFTKNTFKKIGAVLLAGALGIGAIFGIAKLGEVLDTETKTIYPTYSVGGLKTTDGKYTETTDSIYTKEAFECQGLKITPDFDSNVSYEVFFYDSNEQFISSSGKQTDFYENVPSFTKYARIQITPLEDDKVSWYETSKYANQLKVEVNKEQKFNDPLTYDLFVNGEHTLNYVMKEEDSNIIKSASENCGFVKIDVSNMSKIKFVFENEGQAIRNFFVDELGNKVGSNLDLFETDTERTFNVPENAKFLYANYTIGKEYAIFQSR